MLACRPSSKGIANITALKDQLLAAKHVQSKAIEARHAALMKRWSQLLARFGHPEEEAAGGTESLPQGSAARPALHNVDSKPSSARGRGININQPGGALVFMKLLLWKHLGH